MGRVVVGMGHLLRLPIAVLSLAGPDESSRLVLFLDPGERATTALKVAAASVELRPVVPVSRSLTLCSIRRPTGRGDARKELAEIAWGRKVSAPHPTDEPESGEPLEMGPDRSYLPAHCRSQVRLVGAS